MPDDTTYSCRDAAYCRRCDVLVGLDGFHVIEAGERGGKLRVVVKSPARMEGCRQCGVIVGGHGRQDVEFVDVPSFGRPVRLVWRKRSWRCKESACPAGVFTEQHDDVARPRALLSTRERWWAIKQLRGEHSSVAGLARQLGCSWRPVWRSIKPLLAQMAADESRFDGVTTLGVDEHVVRREALLFRMEVRDLHRAAVVAAG